MTNLEELSALSYVRRRTQCKDGLERREARFLMFSADAFFLRADAISAAQSDTSAPIFSVPAHRKQLHLHTFYDEHHVGEHAPENGDILRLRPGDRRVLPEDEAR